MDRAHKALKDTFGFDAFRYSQEAAIERLLVQNENALVLFPTGGGKSLVYQIPALCLDGLTLVISPLISLMKDQVDALVRRGVKAANLDSTLTMERSSWVKAEVLEGRMKILYVAPERLNNEGFVAMMRQVKISLLAVDESHCISQWGASFRPEYLKIARFAEEMDVERVLCLTATATQSVARDICLGFHIDPDAGIFRTPVFRPNLAFGVMVAHSLEEKINAIVPMLRERTGPAILYVTLQKHAEEVAGCLRAHNLQSMVYHAGLPSEERERVQNSFMESENGIVCATIAFGMGIDKANIRQVYHLYMPKTLENFSQEVGRAGRDGLPSTCLMFLSSADIPILEGFARGDTCARTDIQRWIQEIAQQAPASDGCIDFSLYHQAKLYDIRSNVLNLLYAQLELEFGQYIRAVTPFFSLYDITPRTTEGWKALLADESPPAKIIKRHWKSKGMGHQIDVVIAARSASVDRADLTKTINRWEMDGLCTTKASQLRARYHIVHPLPTSPADIATLAQQLFDKMVGREEEAVSKIRQVIEFATADDCLANVLAEYFGDEGVVPDGMCGRCTFCTTGAGVEFDSTATQAVIDYSQIQAILDVCPRNDPRLLSRLAFGVTCPRLTELKLSLRHPLFGSMGHCDFSAILKTFEKECEKCGYSQEPAAASGTRLSKKRPSAPNTSPGQKYGGRTNKRGRF